MTFDRDRLPDPTAYYEAQGLRLSGPRSSKWKTTECRFHGGSDSLRVNVATGAFVCMAGCGARGGDVLGYHRAFHGLGFVEAAKDMGCWVDDGQPEIERRPTPLPPRAALEVLGFEATLCAVAAGNLAKGIALSDVDRERLFVCAGRINQIARYFA